MKQSVTAILNQQYREEHKKNGHSPYNKSRYERRVGCTGVHFDFPNIDDDTIFLISLSNKPIYNILFE